MLYIYLQIRLWETDRNRVEMIPSHLYEDFPSKVGFLVKPFPPLYLWGLFFSLNIFSTLHLLWNYYVQDVFEAACDFARELGGLLWEDSKTMRLIVGGDLHQHMRDFLRRQK